MLLWRADQELQLARDAIRYGRERGGWQWAVWALSHLNAAAVYLQFEASVRSDA